MTPPPGENTWQLLAHGNPWWPAGLADQHDILSWRHSAAILLRDVDPGPIFATLPDLFEAIYDQTAEEICDRLSGAEDGLTWSGWFSIWCEHFSHWNDPIRQLVDRHCAGPDAEHFAQMLPRLDGAAICDFVVGAYEAAQIGGPSRGSQGARRALPLHLPFSTGWPFERLAYGFYKRFCSELDQEPEPARRPMSGLHFDRVGRSAKTRGEGA